MNDGVIASLKKAREKCANTVDKSTIQELDAVIRSLEQQGIKPKSRIKWLSIATKAMFLLRMLAGEFGQGEYFD